MPDPDRRDEVVLTLPAAPEFVRLARLTCAGLATRVGMGYDEVEDLRIAVGEACSLLIGAGREGTLTLTFAIGATAVSVTVAGEFVGDAAGERDTELSDQILAAVVDEHEVDAPNDRVTLVKRHDVIDVPAGAGTA